MPLLLQMLQIQDVYQTRSSQGSGLRAGVSKARGSMLLALGLMLKGSRLKQGFSVPNNRKS